MTQRLARSLLALGLWFFPVWALAQGLQPIPELRARVIDQTGTLDAASTAAIEAKLAAFEQSNGSQVVVVMVATTAPEDIADYTQRLGDAWKVGRRDVGDGVLFVIAKDDRRLRIATAKTLEGAIPDLMAKRIIDGAVTPAFRIGDYAGGIQAGWTRSSPASAAKTCLCPARATPAAMPEASMGWRCSFSSCSPCPCFRPCCVASSATRPAPCLPAWARAAWPGC
jgi:uncharacterized membrane protein YgcG